MDKSENIQKHTILFMNNTAYNIRIYASVARRQIFSALVYHWAASGVDGFVTKSSEIK